MMKNPLLLTLLALAATAAAAAAPAPASREDSYRAINRGVALL